MGVPVITLKGCKHAGRVSASLLSSLGLMELIADTPEDYIIIAGKLAEDKDRLCEYRQTLRLRMTESPLTDGLEFSEKVEQAYRIMWQEYCSSIKN
jgi:predicted O-linked N-acetylglucosamine transferase (SPINDLY family)